MVAEELADAYDRHDRQRLAALSNMQLHRHLDARRLLSDYVDLMWQDAQHQGLDSAVEEERTSVAAVRHLTHHLLATAQDERTRRIGAGQMRVPGMRSSTGRGPTGAQKALPAAHLDETPQLNPAMCRDNRP